MKLREFCYLMVNNQQNMVLFLKNIVMQVDEVIVILVFNRFSKIFFQILIYLIKSEIARKIRRIYDELKNIE